MLVDKAEDLTKRFAPFVPNNSLLKAQAQGLVLGSETLLLECKKCFKTGLNGIYLPMQLTDRLHVALLLIGLTHAHLFCQNWL
jgi:hypothetical protein